MRKAISYRRTVALLVATALLGLGAASCADDSSPNGNGRVACVRDPALIAERRACRADDDCPCGAGCTLGECVAACSADSECSGGWCDQFGRCRRADDLSLVPSLEPAVGGMAGVSAQVVRLLDPSTPQPFTVTSKSGTVGPVRVAADEGLELRCSETGEFVAECRFEEGELGTGRTLWVRATGPLPDGSARVVRVFYGDHEQTVSVTDEPAGGREPATEAALTAGIYAGAARLAAVGVGLDESGALPLDDITVPLEAQVFLGGGGATGALVLVDPTKVLHPEGEWIGRLAMSAVDAGTVDFPTTTYLTGEAANGSGVEVLANAPVADLTVGANGFALDLVLRFDGVLMGNRSPWTRWVVSLSRTGDLPEGARAPGIPPDATPAYSATRGQVATPWEASLAHAMTPRPDSVLTRTAEEKRGLLAVWGGYDPGNLEPCNLTTTVVDSLAQFALREQWGPEPAGTGRVPPLDLTSSGLPIVARLAFPLAAETAVSAAATLRPSTTARVLPCEVDFVSTPTTFTGACGADTSFTFAWSNVDLCDEFVVEYACEVVELAGATMNVEARVSYEDAGGCIRSNNEISIPGTVARVCRLPVVPPSCVEMGLCYEPPATGGSARDSVDAPYLGAGEPLPISGDVACAAGGRTAAIELDLNAELAVGDPARLNAREVWDACDADLAQLRDETAPLLEPFGQGLRTVLTGGYCMQAPRVWWALGAATDPDRRRALDPNAPVMPNASALAHRLLQRWLLQFGFQAREAAEAERMAQVFRAGEEPGMPILPEVGEVLAASLVGWNVLLHPRFATALDGMPGEVLATPDYRPRVTGAAVASQPHHEQTTALPVTMLETFHAQLALVEPRLEDAAMSGTGSGIDELGNVLRLMNVLRPIAVDLAARGVAWAADNGRPAPAWQPAWDGILKSTGGILARLLAYTQSIRAGANPLGIEPEDQPLYFLGEEETPGRRFFAVSDFFIGTGPGAFSWSEMILERLRNSYSEARDAWRGNLERDVSMAQSAAELAGKLDDIRMEYGTKVADACGTPPGLTTVRVLEDWDPFNENTCFVRADNPVCEYDVDAYAGLLDAQKVALHMCSVQELRNRVGNIVGFWDETLNEIADRADTCTFTYPAPCPDGTRRCVQCVTGRETFTAPLSPDSFRQLGGVDAVGRYVLDDTLNICTARFPGVDPHLPGSNDIPNSPATKAECFSGELGNLVFEIQAAADDIEIARSDLADQMEEYDISMESCIIQQVGSELLEATQAAHDSTMIELKGGKLAADLIATAATAVKDCCSMLDVIDDVLTCGARFAVGCTAVGVAAAATGTSQGLTYAMETAQINHDALMASIEHEIEDDKCFNDAEVSMVDADTVSLRIGRAMTDLYAAQTRFNSLKAAVRADWDDGRAALAAARGRYVAPLAHDLWVDEAISAFLRDLRLARRILYLAVRAVEYETQQSLDLAGDVLTARTPTELQAVLDTLWTTSSTRNVGGARPSDLKVVLSLRDELLQLADQSGLAEEEQRLTDVERFRLMLRSPRYAVYDDAGAYLGQQIPFTLAPLGVLGLADPQGIPILAATDCAERLWSVNASILGGAELYEGTTPPTFTRIDLLKRNTFYSQWCSSSADTQFQVGAVRPSRNLFRDPVAGGDYGEGFGPANEQKVYSRARIEAYFNVERADFEADDYANGDTAELAARGLYGDYALFIPAGVVSIDGSDGLVLNQVDDILLRLDYVSVAR